jgi:hypothetical protein
MGSVPVAYNPRNNCSNEQHWGEACKSADKTRTPDGVRWQESNTGAGDSSRQRKARQERASNHIRVVLGKIPGNEKTCAGVEGAGELTHARVAFKGKNSFPSR